MCSPRNAQCSCSCMRIGRPCSNGTCTVVPGRGVALTTLFTSACRAFQDPEGHLPLTYQFSVIRAGQMVALSSPGNSSSLTVCTNYSGNWWHTAIPHLCSLLSAPQVAFRLCACLCRQTLLPSALNMTSLVVISDCYGAAATSTQRNITVSALAASAVRSALTKTASRVQKGRPVNDTSFRQALLVASEVAQLPTANRDRNTTGRT